MAMIAPTVDSVGDAALAGSIIDRSITELQDDIVTELRSYAFQGCNALKKVVFGSLQTTATECFRGCAALTFADFHALTSIATNVFYDSGLETLIIRTNSVCTLFSTVALSGTPIASGAGYIYVPSALVDSYKTTSPWSTYATQIRAIEEWPGVCDPYSWVAVAANIENGTYKDVYKIGDSVPVDLGSEGIINMQVAAFDADTLADGSGTAAISWVAKELLATKKRMNPSLSGTTEGTGTIGGWEKCEMRNYLNDTIKPMIPELVRGQIVAVAKTQNAYDTSGVSVNQITMDEVWIPSLVEISNADSIYKALMPDSSSCVKSVVNTTTASSWWTRYCRNTQSFRTYSTTGSSAQDSSGYINGICLGFCTGKTPA